MLLIIKQPRGEMLFGLDSWRFLAGFSANLCKFSGPFCPPVWAQKATALIVLGLLSLCRRKILQWSCWRQQTTKKSLKCSKATSQREAGQHQSLKAVCRMYAGLEDTPQGLCRKKVSWYRDLLPGQTYCIYCPQHISCLRFCHSLLCLPQQALGDFLFMKSLLLFWKELGFS